MLYSENMLTRDSADDIVSSHPVLHLLSLLVSTAAR